MKEQDWDDSIDAPKPLLDTITLLSSAEDTDLTQPLGSAKSQVTELRRRIEERLEAKRISIEFDYEDLESWPDNLQ